MECLSILPEHLRELILSSNEPLLFKKHLDWGLLTWTLEDWEQLLKKEKLIFRCGRKSFTKESQWERTTRTESATFSDFISFTKTENKEWMYFDYKYLKEWFTNIQKLKENINWGKCGFPDMHFEDSTIWIGSEGAHTPCHIDTYGCNLVAQIYGRKQWILCPPKENLKPTRIPYEESSIYSSLNFFSPTVEDFKGVENCRKVILEPGDVLFVPHKWWHYVENLDTAISINVWLPLPVDDEERLNEALVQMLIGQIVKDLEKDEKNIILNPNSEEDIGHLTLNTSLVLINKCKEVFMEKNKENIKKKDKRHLDQYLLLYKVMEITNDEFLQFLQNQRDRFTNEEGQISQNNGVNELVSLINAFTHPDIVQLVKNKLLK